MIPPYVFGVVLGRIGLCISTLKEIGTLRAGNQAGEGEISSRQQKRLARVRFRKCWIGLDVAEAHFVGPSGTGRKPPGSDIKVDRSILSCLWSGEPVSVAKVRPIQTI